MSWALRLTLVAATFTAASGTCLSSEWRPFRSMCYWPSDYALTWTDAKTICPAMFPGSTLVSIHDLDLDAFIAENVFDIDRRAWLGLSRNSSSDPWVWTDGSTYDFSHWFGGDPGCPGSYECCAAINWQAIGDWSGFDCYDTYSYFMCQLDAS